MGQVCPTCARTTQTIRQCLQQNRASIAKLAKQYALTPKTFDQFQSPLLFSFVYAGRPEIDYVVNTGGLSALCGRTFGP